MDAGLLALAVQDFFPGILSAIGFVALARLSGERDPHAGRLVWAGAGLVVLGGLSKPLYKSMVAVSSGDLDVIVLDDVLFWLLAPGFLVAGAGLRAASRFDTGRPPTRRAWSVGAAAATVLGAAVLATTTDGRAWFLLLLAVATGANLWVVVVLVRWATARDDGLAATLFVVNVVIVLGLAWSAAALPQTIPVQWGEQLASTAAQGAFLYGAVRLARAGSPVPATA